MSLEERKQKFDHSNADAEIGGYLQNIPLLAKLSELERNKLASLMKVKHYSDGSNIITQGEVGTEFFIIKSGRAVVILEDKEAKSHSEIAELKEKDYFGEHALLHRGLRTATIQSRGETSCLSLDEESFLSMFSREKLNVRFIKRNAIAEARDQKEAPEQKASVDKTAEQLAFLENSLKEHVLFQSIDADNREFIVKQMWKQDVPSGTVVIKEGDQGNHFFVIESGAFEVLKKHQDEFTGERSENVVNYLETGKSFGELALMYNSPRAASVQAVADSSCWVLDRRTFRIALRKVNREKMAEYTTFLESVPLFHSLLSSERAKIAEALEEVWYHDGDPIMVQGEEGDTFFILKKGEAVVKKDSGGVVQEVQRCARGDFFGERALIKNEPRAASVVAKGHTCCLKIHREEFQQLLGHVQDILKERVESLDTPKAPASPSSASTAQPKAVATETTLLPIKKEDLVVKNVLGKGSFGIVMLVKDKNSHHTYALKRLNKAQMVQIGQHLHVANERNVMVQLNHPFIIKLRATYKDRDSLYFLMDVAMGGDLFALLRNQTLFDEKVARFYAASIVLAFEHMHSKDIVHRDLKPENVLIDTDGYIKLTDFGFAKVCKDRTWTLCGTPDYLAPEVIQGKGHGKGVDWWTLGILIYEMLASYPPFYDEDPMMTYAKIARGKITIPKHFSRRAVDLIKRLLHPKPTNRLGVLKGGASLIKQHPWFDGFDWEALEKKAMMPPFIPEVKNDTDTSHFLNTNIEDDPIEAFMDDSSSWDDCF